jgi:hypothetical protein
LLDLLLAVVGCPVRFDRHPLLLLQPCRTRLVSSQLEVIAPGVALQPVGPGQRKAAACPRNTAMGTARAAMTASAALAAPDLADDLTQDAMPAAATTATMPQRNVTVSTLGSGSTPPRAISTTPCVSHMAPPTSAAQAATLRRLITSTSVPHERCDVERRASLRHLSVPRSPPGSAPTSERSLVMAQQKHPITPGPEPPPPTPPRRPHPAHLAARLLTYARWRGRA